MAQSLSPASPSPAPTIQDPRKPLLDLADSLTASARAIDDFIDAQQDPYSLQCQQLRTKEQAIVDAAGDLTASVMQQITQDISGAVGRLKGQIDIASTTLAEVKEAAAAISIAAAILAAASGAITGGSLATVPALLALATQIDTAVSAAGGNKGT